MLEAVHAQKDRAAATTKAKVIGETLIAMRLPVAAKCVASGVQETFNMRYDAST